MANGIVITDLRHEIQTLVNSNTSKYDPNANGIIDEGDELSLLLSEYDCKERKLTSKRRPNHIMLTKDEKQKVSEELENVKYKGHIPVIIAGALAAFDVIAGSREYNGAPPMVDGNGCLSAIALPLAILIGVGMDLCKRICKRNDAINLLKYKQSGYEDKRYKLN